MRAFRFNLQKVLDYRETVEDALQTELAEISTLYEREVRRLAEITNARDTFRGSMKRKLADGDPDLIRQAHKYLTDLSERICAQEGVVRELAQRKETKRAEVVEASRDRQMLDKLKGIRAGEHRREMFGEEQKFLDDLAGVRHKPSRI